MSMLGSKNIKRGRQNSITFPDAENRNIMKKIFCFRLETLYAGGFVEHGIKFRLPNSDTNKP